MLLADTIRLYAYGTSEGACKGAKSKGYKAREKCGGVSDESESVRVPGKGERYYWHATTKDRLKGILQNGLDPSKSLGYQKFTYLTTSPRFAEWWAKRRWNGERTGVPVILKLVNKKNLKRDPNVERGTYKSLFVEKDRIGVRDIVEVRVLTKSGWKEIKN